MAASTGGRSSPARSKWWQLEQRPRSEQQERPRREADSGRSRRRPRPWPCRLPVVDRTGQPCRIEYGFGRADDGADHEGGHRLLVRVERQRLPELSAGAGTQRHRRSAAPPAGSRREPAGTSSRRDPGRRIACAGRGLRPPDGQGRRRPHIFRCQTLVSGQHRVRRRSLEAAEPEERLSGFLQERRGVELISLFVAGLRFRPERARRPALCTDLPGRFAIARKQAICPGGSTKPALPGGAVAKIERESEDA